MWPLHGSVPGGVAYEAVPPGLSPCYCATAWLYVRWGGLLGRTPLAVPTPSLLLAVPLVRNSSVPPGVALRFRPFS